MPFANIEAKRAYQAEWWRKNSVKQKAYCLANKEDRAAKRRIYDVATKEDRAKKQKAYRESHRELISARTQVYRSTHRVQINEWARNHRKERREWALKSNYGISLRTYDELLIAQGGVCAICKNAPSGKGRETCLHVDHDHASGRVRGLLCNRCNRALGWMGDSAELMKAMYFYITKYAQMREAVTPTKSKLEVNHAD